MVHLVIPLGCNDKNDFTLRMRGMGLRSVLEFLGPLEPLDAIGSVGAHLVYINERGKYIDKYNHKFKCR